MPEIMREEMLKLFNEMESEAVEQWGYPYHGREMATAIRALLTAPPDRDDDAMREKVNRPTEAVNRLIEAAKGIDTWAYYESLKSPEIVALRAALAEVGKPEVDAEVTKREVEKS
jgi:hypothetical protein